MRKIVLLIASVLLLFSCEEVIDIDLNDSEPRLVIEASLNLLKADGAPFNSYIRLTTTAHFFDDSIPIVDDAFVEIIDETGRIFYFNHTSNGYYQGIFVPKKDVEYTLKVYYNNEIYTASTHYIGAPALERVEQRNDGGFTGDQIELKVYFTDPADEENYYYFVGSSIKGNRRDVMNDRYFNGNTIFGFYVAEDLAPEDEVEFLLYGITEEFHDYMFALLEQTGNGSGPFETQPATVRGNIINETNRENYPLGYFRISEVSLLMYRVE